MLGRENLQSLPLAKALESANLRIEEGRSSNSSDLRSFDATQFKVSVGCQETKSLQGPENGTLRLKDARAKEEGGLQTCLLTPRHIASLYACRIQGLVAM